jgi:phage gpG-like protein
MPSEFIWNEAELAYLLRSAEGPVGRDLYRRGVQVESAAKLRASNTPHGYFRGVQYPSAQGSGPGVRTGRLRSSISTRVETDALGVYAKVGTNVYYAPYLELGTRYMPAGYPFLRPSLKAAEI